MKGCLCVKILLFLVIQIAVIPGISKGDELPKFENVMSSVGISEKPMLGQTAAWNDYNSDGLLDIFITNTKIKRNARYPKNTPKILCPKPKRISINSCTSLMSIIPVIVMRTHHPILKLILTDFIVSLIIAWFFVQSISKQKRINFYCNFFITE